MRTKVTLIEGSQPGFFSGVAIAETAQIASAGRMDGRANAERGRWRRPLLRRVASQFAAPCRALSSLSARRA